MQIHKPSCLGLSTRPIEYRRRYGLCISASLHVPFEQAEGGTLWGEQSMWDFLAAEMAVPVIDEGVAKLTAEFLVHGRAWPPPHQPGACAVRARVGPAEKTLLVFGDRSWNGDRPTAPAPFAGMPLDWARAYGGPDFALNPGGRGRAAADGIQWLPNIEAPQERLLRPDQAANPAGFGALEPLHPWRAQYRGTYGEDYLREHAPGFAPDLDWRYFNLASPDQWFAQPLVGDEPFAFDHMHPAQAQVQGRLPGLRARSFASYAQAEGPPVLREVPLRLTTAWFFPHAMRCVLIFQGLAEIGTDDGSDIVGLLGAVERVGQARADAHYTEVLERRADPRVGGIHALNDADLLPEGLDTRDPAGEVAREAFASPGKQAEVQRHRAEWEVAMARQQARDLGQDPDALGIRLPPATATPSEPGALAAHLLEQHELAQHQHWAVVDDVLKQVEQALEMVKTHGAKAVQAATHRGPPRFSAETRLDEMTAQAAALGRPLDPSGPYPHLIRQEAAERDGYLQSAHAQMPADRMAPAPARALRGEIERAVAAGLRRFAEMDLTGADLSGLDLRGCDFGGAWLESATLAGANVSGARFVRAVLAHADLQGAMAVGTDFTQANLGRARLAGAVLDEACLEGAMLMHSDFRKTQLRRARLARAQWIESRWGEADWSGVQAPGQVFHRVALEGMVLAEADLSRAVFFECGLQGVDLQGATLAQASFVGCRLDGVRLAGAVLDGASFVQGCSLAQADLRSARLAGANLAGCDLRGARLMQANLDGALLSSAVLEQADLRLARAEGALMRRTRLRQANLAGVLLKDAVLQHADLRGADLRRSNLFAADLSRVRFDGDVRLEEALLTRARTWPRLSREEQEKA